MTATDTNLSQTETKAPDLIQSQRG